ncbi:uncharacterized protein [Temnothorax longispinosus]|uniref:uncharacterized protein n=1 Tax=Temnothorax longispinosus TaxID=300112 RepID=UPI003A99CEA8
MLLFQVCIGVVLAAPAEENPKQKRDILPGDPRYGTEEHHHQEHEHHEHENEVQISKSAGGYVGSYTLPDDTEDHSLFQVQPQSSYGPPTHTPGKPLGSDFLASGDADQTQAPLLVPSTSYGIPDNNQIFNNNYLIPANDDKNSAIIKTTIQEQPKFDTVHVQKSAIPEGHDEAHHVQQPAVVQKHVENIPHTVSLPQVKVTASHLPTDSQGAIQHNIPSFTSAINNLSKLDYTIPSYSNIPVKTLDRHVHVGVPQPYHVPVTKHVAVRIPIPHTVEVPKPYYVRVPQPVQVTVDRAYPVEVPRPVPYPVHHYVRTSVPVAHHHLTVDTKDNPLQTFFENPQATYQNVLSGIPTFSNPFADYQNPFQNFASSINFPSLPSFPSFPSFPDVPSIPSIPSVPNVPNVPSVPGAAFVPSTPGKNTGYQANVHSLSNSDSVTIDNAVLKSETISKPVHIKAQQGYKGPSTACAGCTITSASSKQEYVQPIDANGGYVY